MEVVEEEERPLTTVRPKLVRRPRGVYRLTDFIIQRTLGTGSFGRVHLGSYTSTTTTRRIPN
jgi:protein kinase A